MKPTKTHGGARKGAGRPKGKGQFGEPTKPIRLPESLIEPVLKFVKNKAYQLPLYESKVAAGSPLPASDSVENHIDLNDFLIKHPATTFLVRVSGESMIEAGIYDNDLLVVDRALQPKQGRIVVAAVDGHLTVKRLQIIEDELFLLPENKQFKPIAVKNDIHIWGVVTNVIHEVK